MEKQRIYVQKNERLSDEDKLDLCRLLVKAGYAVRIGRENVGTGEKKRYERFIEYWVG